MMKKEGKKWRYVEVRFPDSDEGQRDFFTLGQRSTYSQWAFCLASRSLRHVCPYTLCTGRHFEPASSLHIQYSLPRLLILFSPSLHIIIFIGRVDCNIVYLFLNKPITRSTCILTYQGQLSCCINFNSGQLLFSPSKRKKFNFSAVQTN